MAKIQIKSEKLTPFGGIFSIMEKFDSMLSPVIDSTLGQRCSSIFGYQFSEIVRSLMSVYFCGGWKSHATLTPLAKQDLPTFGYNMIDPLKSWCWGSILFYPFKISRFS